MDSRSSVLYCTCTRLVEGPLPETSALGGYCITQVQVYLTGILQVLKIWITFTYQDKIACFFTVAHHCFSYSSSKNKRYEQPTVKVVMTLTHESAKSVRIDFGAYPGLPPDIVIIVFALSSFQVAEWVHRRHIGPLFRAYVKLPFRDRFDWDRRAINITFQFLQLFCNGYLLTLDRAATADYLYGYSSFAHFLFIVIIAFYIYDTCGIVMHPSPGSTYIAWIIHHVIAIGLLLFDVSFKRYSAFPAATFLISAAGHIPNELRWFCAAMNVQSQAMLNFTLVLCALISIVTLAIPPPYLLWKAAGQLGISIFQLITTRMRPYCIFFFSLIYLPHVGLVLHQIRRMRIHWGKPAEPFRTRKVE